MEKMNVLLVKPNEHPKKIQIDSGLESLQKAVGGLIQAIYPYSDPVALIMDDEGKWKHYEPNRLLRTEDGEVYDFIAGDFLVVGLGEENFESLPDELAEKYARKFYYPEFRRYQGYTK